MHNERILSGRGILVHRLGPDTVDEGQKEKAILNESQGMTSFSPDLLSSTLSFLRICGRAQREFSLVKRNRTESHQMTGEQLGPLISKAEGQHSWKAEWEKEDA